MDIVQCNFFFFFTYDLFLQYNIFYLFMICSVDLSFHQGSRTNIGGIKDSDEVTSNFQKDSPPSSSFSPNHNRVPCGSTDSPSPASSLTSLYEDVDSGKFCL